jgi:hypothetical protein
MKDYKLLKKTFIDIYRGKIKVKLNEKEKRLAKKLEVELTKVMNGGNWFNNFRNWTGYSKPEEQTDCSKVITILQKDGICWFSSLLMCIFYSQYSRKLLMNNMEYFKILNIPASLTTLLKSYYRHDNNNEVIIADNILNDLHVHDKVKFPVSKKFYKNLEKGYYSDYYIKPIYDLLDISTLILSINTNEQKVGYNKVNNLYYKDPYSREDYHYHVGNNLDYLNIIKKNTPDILILFDSRDNVHDNVHKYLNKDDDLTTLEDALNKKYNELSKFKDKIVFNGYIYKLDSILISNYNNNLIGRGHGIAGITCNNERFVYNGWRNGSDHNSHPCSLFKHNWRNWTYSKGFCLPKHGNMCELISSVDSDLCFNFSNRDTQRIIFYVKHKKSSSYFTFSNNSHTDIKEYTKPDIDESLLNNLIKGTTTAETNLVNDKYRNTNLYQRFNRDFATQINKLNTFLKAKIIEYPIRNYIKTYNIIADIDLLSYEDIKNSHEGVQTSHLLIEDLKKKYSEIFDDDDKTYITKALLYMFFSTMRSASDNDYDIKKKEIVPIYNIIKNVNAIFNFFSEDDIADLDNKYNMFIKYKFYETYETYDIPPVPVEINNQGGKRKPKKTRKN